MVLWQSGLDLQYMHCIGLLLSRPILECYHALGLITIGLLGLHKHNQQTHVKHYMGQDGSR